MINACAIISSFIHTLVPYGFLPITSGAIQYGVPTSEVFLLLLGVKRPQYPKSDNLTRPSLVTSIQSLLMSRWMMSHECRNTRASRQPLQMYATSSSFKLYNHE